MLLSGITVTSPIINRCPGDFKSIGTVRGKWGKSTSKSNKILNSHPVSESCLEFKHMGRFFFFFLHNIFSKSRHKCFYSKGKKKAIAPQYRASFCSISVSIRDTHKSFEHFCFLPQLCYLPFFFFIVFVIASILHLICASHQPRWWMRQCFEVTCAEVVLIFLNNRQLY